MVLTEVNVWNLLLWRLVIEVVTENMTVQGKKGRLKKKNKRISTQE